MYSFATVLREVCFSELSSTCLLSSPSTAYGSMDTGNGAQAGVEQQLGEQQLEREQQSNLKKQLGTRS